MISSDDRSVLFCLILQSGNGQTVTTCKYIVHYRPCMGGVALVDQSDTDPLAVCPYHFLNQAKRNKASRSNCETGLVDHWWLQ